MSEVEPTSSQEISILRLRLGIFLLVVWWLPIYLTLPSITKLLGINTATGRKDLFIAIIAVQTAVGLIGLVLVGKELAQQLRRVRYKKIPRTIWNIVVKRQTDIEPTYLKPIKKKRARAHDLG